MMMILWAVSGTRRQVTQIVTHPGCHKMCCQAFLFPQSFRQDTDTRTIVIANVTIINQLRISQSLFHLAQYYNRERLKC